MRIQFMNAALRTTGLLLGALALLSGNVRAQDQVLGISYGTSGSASVTITYTGSGGQQSTFAEQFGVETVTPVAGTSFTAFCIDLWHNQGQGNYSYQASTITSNFASAIIPNGVTASVSDPGLTNQLTYLGTIFNASSTGNVNEMGAIQLAIWNLIDKGFSINSAPSGMMSDYNAIQSLLAGTSPGSGDFAGFTAYSSSNIYSGASVYLADYSKNSGAGLYPGQNLITWGDGIGIQSTPEPSTMALAGLGALGLIGYGVRRRKAMGA